MIEFFDFSKALEHLKKGKDIARKGWNGKGLKVSAIMGYGVGLGLDGYTRNPYLRIYSKGKKTTDTWIPSVSDLFAEDWYLED